MMQCLKMAQEAQKCRFSALRQTNHTMMSQTATFSGVRVAPKVRVASARVAVAPVASLQKVRAQSYPHST